MSNGRVREHIEDEIARELTIPEIEGVPEFIGTLTENDLQKYPKEHQPLVIGMNRLADGLDWACSRIVDTNHYQRILQAELIRVRKQVTKAFWGIVTTLIVIFLTALAGAWAMRIFKVL